MLDFAQTSCPDFEVIIPCSTNGDRYAQFLIRNMLETCSGEHVFEIHIGVNNFPEFDSSLFDEFASSIRVTIHAVDTPTELGSMGHGLVSDHLFSLCKSSYVVLIDVDCAFLVTNWDKQLLQNLQQNEGIIGTEYNERSNLTKYRHYPSVVACMVDAKVFRDNNVSFCPHPNKGAHVVSEEHEWAFSRPRGSKIYLDTGYEIPIKLKKNHKGKCLKFAGTGVLGVGQEFQLDGVPFVTHLKGSSTTSFLDPRSQLWQANIKNFLQKTKQNDFH